MKRAKAVMLALSIIALLILGVSRQAGAIKNSCTAFCKTGPPEGNDPFPKTDPDCMDSCQNFLTESGPPNGGDSPHRSQACIQAYRACMMKCKLLRDIDQRAQCYDACDGVCGDE